MKPVRPRGCPCVPSLAPGGEAELRRLSSGVLVSSSTSSQKGPSHTSLTCPTRIGHKGNASGDSASRILPRHLHRPGKRWSRPGRGDSAGHTSLNAFPSTTKERDKRLFETQITAGRQIREGWRGEGSPHPQDAGREDLGLPPAPGRQSPSSAAAALAGGNIGTCRAKAAAAGRGMERAGAQGSHLNQPLVR